jgi:hypothetical protein
MATQKEIWAPVSLACGLISLTWMSPTGSLSSAGFVHFGFALAGIVAGVTAWRSKALRPLAAVGIVVSSLMPIVLLLLYSGAIGFMFVSH